jgi:hypothetical protein
MRPSYQSYETYRKLILISESMDARDTVEHCDSTPNTAVDCGMHKSRDLNKALLEMNGHKTIHDNVSTWLQKLEFRVVRSLAY